MTATDTSAEGADLRALLRPGAIVPVFQPIVDLATGDVVAFEALARWPDRPELLPDDVFVRALELGLLPELEWACRRATLTAALNSELRHSGRLFINVEAATLGLTQPPDLDELVRTAAEQLDVVLELTERSLMGRPADLLRLVDWARGRGGAIAMDDVGSDPESLAMVPFVRPEILKLDMSLVQGTPSARQARTLSAILAHVENTGALLLAEGVETQRDLEQARAVGARLGQGWLLGREVARPSPAHPIELPVTEPPPAVAPTPFEIVADTISTKQLRTGRKPLLLALTRHLEAQALAYSEGCVVLAACQRAELFGAGMRRRYSGLVTVCPLVGVLAEGLDQVAIPRGVRTVSLQRDDPLTREWAIVVVSSHFAGALIAREITEPTAPPPADALRRFSFVMTHDRELVVAAGRSLLYRIVGQAPASGSVPPAGAGQLGP